MPRVKQSMSMRSKQPAGTEFERKGARTSVGERPEGADEPDRVLEAGRTAYLGLRYRGSAPQWRSQGARRPRTWTVFVTATTALVVVGLGAALWTTLAPVARDAPSDDAVRMAAASGARDRQPPAHLGDLRPEFETPDPPQPGADAAAPGSVPGIAPAPNRPTSKSAPDGLDAGAAGGSVATSRGPWIERGGFATLERLRREADRIDRGAGMSPRVSERPPMTLRLPNAPPRWSPGPPPVRGAVGD